MQCTCRSRNHEKGQKVIKRTVKTQGFAPGNGPLGQDSPAGALYDDPPFAPRLLAAAASLTTAPPLPKSAFHNHACTVFTLLQQCHDAGVCLLVHKQSKRRQSSVAPLAYAAAKQQSKGKIETKTNLMDKTPHELFGYLSTHNLYTMPTHPQERARTLAKTALGPRQKGGG